MSSQGHLENGQRVLPPAYAVDNVVCQRGVLVANGAFEDDRVLVHLGESQAITAVPDADEGGDPGHDQGESPLHDVIIAYFYK